MGTDGTLESCLHIADKIIKVWRQKNMAHNI
jgi:hypothetical protein